MGLTLASLVGVMNPPPIGQPDQSLVLPPGQEVGTELHPGLWKEQCILWNSHGGNPDQIV